MFFLRSSVLGVPVIPTNTMKKRGLKNMKQHKIRRKTPKCGLYFLWYYLKKTCDQKTLVVPSLNRHSRQTNTPIATNSRDMGEVQDRCSNYSRENFGILKTRKTQVIVPDSKRFPNRPPHYTTCVALREWATAQTT